MKLANPTTCIQYPLARRRFLALVSGGLLAAPLAAGAQQAGVDVLVTDSTQAALAAKSATSTIPIVMAVVGDPVGTGLVGSLARPGGNITGMSLMTPELSAKRLALLKEAVPNVGRVAVLLNPGNRTSPLYPEMFQNAATFVVKILKGAKPSDTCRSSSPPNSSWSSISRPPRRSA